MGDNLNRKIIKSTKNNFTDPFYNFDKTCNIEKYKKKECGMICQCVLMKASYYILD